MARIRAPAGTNLPLSQATVRVRGRLILYQHKGQPVAASWPGKRLKEPNAEQLEQRQDFAKLAQATKNVEATQQASARLIAEGSKYTWRDILSLAMTGQIGDFPNYGEIVSQYTLDILGKEPGMIIIRADEWIALVAGLNAQVLTMVGGLPAWEDLPAMEVALTGDVTAPLGSGTLTTTLSATGVTPGAYTLTSLTVDSKGRITAASSGTATAYINQLTGDVTAGPGSGSQAATLSTTGVAAGSYTLASLTVDAKGRLTSVSSGSAAGAGTVPHPGFAAGRYYTSEQSAALSQISMVANRLYAVPFYVGSPFTFTKMGIFVTVTAAGLLELGVYDNLNGAPNNIEHDCGSVAISANNTPTQITGRTITLGEGYHWLVVGSNATPAVRSTPTSDSANFNTLGTANTGTNTTGYTGCTGTWTFSAGNLPTTFPTPTFNTANTPIAFIGT